jgi:hypothetical protein
MTKNYKQISYFEDRPEASVEIFEELENFLEFCRDYGYVYDEANRGKMSNYAWQQFSKFCSHKNFRDQWADDGRKQLTNFS